MKTVGEILETKGRDVYSTSGEATVLQAVDEMCRVHVGALLVREQKVPVGVFSERDVMTRVILRRRDPAKTPVADVMTRNVVCIDVDRSIEEAMAIMTEQRCRHLPVVIDEKVVGLVSIGDLVRWVTRDQEYELRMLYDYVEGRYPG
jgi:CBS domain-containing protein